jgi:hypothetical protein
MVNKQRMWHVTYTGEKGNAPRTSKEGHLGDKDYGRDDNIKMELTESVNLIEMAHDYFSSMKEEIS